MTHGEENLLIVPPHFGNGNGRHDLPLVHNMGCFFLWVHCFVAKHLI